MRLQRGPLMARRQGQSVTSPAWLNPLSGTLAAARHFDRIPRTFRRLCFCLHSRPSTLCRALGQQACIWRAVRLSSSVEALAICLAVTTRSAQHAAVGYVLVTCGVSSCTSCAKRPALTRSRPERSLDTRLALRYARTARIPHALLLTRSACPRAGWLLGPRPALSCTRRQRAKHTTFGVSPSALAEARSRVQVTACTVT